MNSSQFRVFVCTKCELNSTDRCCNNVTAIEIYHAFQSEINKYQLEDRVEIRQSGCLDRCEAGVVAMVARVNISNLSWLPTKIQKRMLPNKQWYTNLIVSDIPKIVENQFIN
jgi:predicted metal-binding protein